MGCCDDHHSRTYLRLFAEGKVKWDALDPFGQSTVERVRAAGRLTGEEFRCNETSIPQPSDDQVLARNLW